MGKRKIIILAIAALFLLSVTAATPEYTDRELAEKFAPVVSLHSEEKYEPINAEWFIRNSDLMKKEDGWLSNDTLVDKTPTTSTLKQYDSEEYYLDLTDKYWQNYESHNGDATQTVYYRVVDTEKGKILQYWFFYAYSAWKPKSSFIDAFEHESDWEMVQFHLSEDRYYFPSESSFAQHYIGKSSHWTNQRKSQTHPYVFPSENGHASYYTSGYQEYHCYEDLSIIDSEDGMSPCGGYEYTGSAENLPPSEYELVNIEEQEWLGWGGRWGEGRNSGPQGKTDYFGNNVWDSPVDWSTKRSSYSLGALDPSYSPPSAQLSRPPEVNPEETVIFEAEGSDDQDYLEYHWEFGEVGFKLADSTAQFKFDHGGDYNVQVAVVDNEGAAAVEEITYHVNRYPRPFFQLLEDEVKTFEKVNLEEDSYDPDGTIAERIWNFAGNEVDGTSPTISFKDDGEYRIELTVEDNDGLRNSSTKTVEVMNRKPDPEFSYSPDNIYFNTTVKFSDESTDRDGQIAQRRWLINEEQVSSSNKFTHVFRNATGGVSTYEITLSVEDDDAAEATTTESIEISNYPPSVDINANTTNISAGDTVKFSYKVSDPDGEISNTKWILPNGKSTSKEVVTYLFERGGTRQVKLTATDNAGAKSSERFRVEVNAGVVTRSKNALSAMIGSILELFI